MILILLSFESYAQKFYQTAKIIDQPANQWVNQRFVGMSVALNDTKVLVGSRGMSLKQLVHGDPRTAPSYLVSLGVNGHVINNNPIKFDWTFSTENTITGFGQAVALSNTYAVVGEKHYYELGVGQSTDDYGAAYVYEQSEAWAVRHRLRPNDPIKREYFGCVVAIADQQIIVGTDVYTGIAADQGRVYVFEKDGNNNWVQVQKLGPDTQLQQFQLNKFGVKLAVSGDYLVVASGYKAYIFKRTAGVWHQSQVVEISAPNESNAISDVAISGNTIALASKSAQRDLQGQNMLFQAGAVYVYEKGVGEVWTYTQKLVQADRMADHSFGDCISMDNDLMVIGATGVKTDANNNNSRAYSDGAAYVFKRGNNGQLTQFQKLTPNDRSISSVSEYFGYAVAVKGNRIAVGSVRNCTDLEGKEIPASYMMGAGYVFTAFQTSALPTTVATASSAFGKISELTLLSENKEPVVKLGISGNKNLYKNFVQATVWKHAAEQSANGKLYLSRSYQITPTKDASTSTATVTLFFSQQEFLDFNNNPAKTADFPISPSDAQGIANIRILKISGSSNDNSGQIGSFTGTSQIINPDDDKIVWNAADNRWEVTFDVTGFSGFFANTEQTILPVQLLKFTAKREQNSAKLYWETASERNNKGFEVYRKTADNDFVKIADLHKNEQNLAINSYSYTDYQPQNGINYYKLVQVDNDGKATELGLRSLEFSISLPKVNIYPNPAQNQVNLSFESGLFNQVLLMDLQGKVLTTFSLSSSDTTHSLMLDNLPSGTYLVKLHGKESIVQKIIKQ